MQWIDVKDMLPELTDEQKLRLTRDYDGTFSILSQSGTSKTTEDCCIARYSDGDVCIVSKAFRPSLDGKDGFLFWMPIPELQTKKSVCDAIGCENGFIHDVDSGKVKRCGQCNGSGKKKV